MSDWSFEGRASDKFLKGKDPLRERSFGERGSDSSLKGKGPSRERYFKERSLKGKVLEGKAALRERNPTGPLKGKVL